MATKKDLVEAYSFNRRRLVTAFVSGAPGGREVEPARPGRMVVGGAALAVLLIAGAAIAGTLTRSAPVDWSQAGLVTDDRGALYVILEKGRSPGQPTLRPVINVTSAQLILGSTTDTKSVRQKDIASRDKGPAIGILDAPATVPPADRLIQSGWTSCTGDAQGMRTVLAGDTAVRRTPSSGLLVTDGTTQYLVAEATGPREPRRAYRYALPAGNDGLVSAVAKAGPQDVQRVPAKWLDLLPEGPPLTAEGLNIPDLGKPAGAAGYGDAVVGDYTVRDDTTYVITRQGAVRLTPFIAKVLQATPLPGGRLPREVTLAAGATFDSADGDPFADLRWPTDVLAGVADRNAEVCAVLETGKDQIPAVRVGVAVEGSDLAAPVKAETAPTQVASGRGALVRVGGFDATNARLVYLVDDRGRTYPVASSVEVANLGYTEVAPVVVPDAWNRLFVPGPELSQLAALCPPAPEGQAAASAPAPGGSCS